MKRRKNRKAQAVWVPPGQAVTVGDFTIIDGMVYVGQMLKTPGGLGAEPSVIDPSLPCRAGAPGRLRLDSGGGTSYSTLSPEGRAGYLEWLARGRPDPLPSQTYLFLFFCGIERRLLRDLRPSRESQEETAALLAELERLLEIHGKQYGFLQSAVALAILGRLQMGDRRPESYEPVLGSGARSRFVQEIGPSLAAAAGEPLSPAWAYALWDGWDGARRKTPAFRCPAEVRALFRIRYREMVPDGLQVHPTRKALEVFYHPANPSLPAPFVLRPRGVPEARLIRGQIDRLQQVADRVFADLAPYSRWVGKSSPASPAALAYLPPELARG